MLKGWRQVARDSKYLNALFTLLSLGAIVVAGENAAVDFNKLVRPILSDRCFACHGPDENSREAELRLDTFEGATAKLGDYRAIAPGSSSTSILIERVASTDDDYRMPPAESGTKLTAAEIDVLRRWIDSGAEYSRHWAFESVRRPSLPNSQTVDWGSNSIDAFVLEKLKEHSIQPSKRAERATLIRRVYLDLLGLPPQIADVNFFLSDEDPDAYEKLVDRVLASPRFGERWGRHWLDQARYADSHGYTNDNRRSIWPYRDWVIEAINRDLPFDQFTIEQLAGDQLPDPTLDQLVATGFHRNTLINSEGGTKADQFRDEQVKDRIDTTGLVWMGLTIGCAKCHSHKFDPISQKEYYQLYSFLNSTVDANSESPTIKAPSRRQRQQMLRLKQRRVELRSTIENDGERDERQRDWESQLAERVDDASEESTRGFDWTILDLDSKSNLKATLTKLDDKSILASGKNLPNDEYRLTAWSPLTKVRSVRVEVLTDDSLPNRGPGRSADGNFLLSEFWFRTGDGRELRFNKAQADHSQQNHRVTHAIDGNSKTGWSVGESPDGGANHNRVAWFVLPKTLEVEKGHALTFVLQFENGESVSNLGRLRLSISSDVWDYVPSKSDLAKLARLPRVNRNDEQQKLLDKYFLADDEKLSSAFEQLKIVEKEISELSANYPTTMVLRELDSPREAYVQTRGDFLRRGLPVESNVPTILPPMDPSKGNRSRYDFAAWIVDPSNPLTARVRVNRIWMRLFGKGLVETENDFGTQGTLPSHPKLLDWLASEFTRREWSTKQLIRFIVCSETYRQSSVHRDDLASVDPLNRWLGRQNRNRVEAEIVRDLGLSVSGLIDSTIGGPSVFPPQPKGVYAFTQRAKNWKTDTSGNRFRRGIYTFFYRSAPYPMLTTFDVPRFNQTCTQRMRSNTPLQALTVANGQAMVEIAQQLGRRILTDKNGQDVEAKITYLYNLCFARSPNESELRALIAFFDSQHNFFADNSNESEKLTGEEEDSNAENTAELAAWIATSRVVLNLDEFITRE